MADYKKQHFVPQFYLRNFSDPIFCYDKAKDESFQAKVSDIAYENYFYETSGTKFGEIEKLLSDMEKEFSQAISEVFEKCNNERLSPVTFGNLCTFTIIQMLRTNVERIRLKEIHTSMLDDIVKRKFGEEILKKIKIVPTEDTLKINHLKFLLSVYPSFVEMIFLKGHAYIGNNSEMPFWTSDNPVVLHNNLGGDVGLKEKNTEIHVPLKNDLTFVLYDPEYKMKVDENFAWYSNILQVINSIRFVYSKINNFDIAREFLQKNPIYRDPERERMTIINQNNSIEVINESFGKLSND